MRAMLRSLHKFTVFCLKILLGLYRRFISPFLGQNCRHYPTCSAYSREAIERHGALFGVYLTAHRILRCHPWGGKNWIDPVPDQFAWRDVLGYKRARIKKADTNLEDKVLRYDE